MSDIVERLRCLDITRQFSGGQHEVINAAIDEIERLRLWVEGDGVVGTKCAYCGAIWPNPHDKRCEP